MIIICYMIMVFAPYLICGINSAIIVTKITTGKDIRTMGSGNAGLTNTLRTQGKTAAAIVLFGDVLKGVISILIVRFAFLFLAGIDTSVYENNMNWIAYAAGIISCLGHNFPVYFGFKGGKGVLVTVAVLYTIDWVSASVLLGLFLIITAFSRYVSLGSVIAGSLYPFCVLIISLINNDPSAWLNFICGVFISGILVFMHRENIKRLRSGTEKKLGVKI